MRKAPTRVPSKGSAGYREKKKSTPTQLSWNDRRLQDGRRKDEKKGGKTRWAVVKGERDPPGFATKTVD